MRDTAGSRTLQTPTCRRPTAHGNTPEAEGAGCRQQGCGLPEAAPTPTRSGWRRKFRGRVAVFGLALGLLVLCLPVASGWPSAGVQPPWLEAVGPRDAVLVADPQGHLLVEKNAQQPLIPASTLKLLTSLVALHHLGADHRFGTDFFRNASGDLKIRGYGDPLLVSETVAVCASRLARHLEPWGGRCADIIVDDTFFEAPLTIPGVTDSPEPYDAPNGALCVNFNTALFRRTAKGRLVSGEPQTPLLDFARERIRRRNPPQGRVVFTHDDQEIALYAGHLFAHFLRRQGVRTEGIIAAGKADPARDHLLFRHYAPLPLAGVIARLLKYSNNFIANQLLIASGARVYGPPGNLSKGIRAALAYARRYPGSETLHLAEGSGISRANRVSAQTLAAVVEAFRPYHSLLPHEEGDFFKTGTLKGIRTRAGLRRGPDGRLYSYVLLINTPGKAPQKLLRAIRNTIDSQPAE